MKRLIQRFLVTVLALYLLISYYPGLSGPSNWQSLAIAAGIYLFLEIVIKPVLKLFLIPINILTLGMASFLVNIILLYLLVILLPDINIMAFTIGPYYLGGYFIPQLTFGYWGSLALTSFLLSFTSSFLQWILL
ncbi:MAG: phage holin family protein [bacterium]|nr:phage holin family protein [bacterium]